MELLSKLQNIFIKKLPSWQELLFCDSLALQTLWKKEILCGIVLILVLSLFLLSKYKKIDPKYTRAIYFICLCLVVFTFSIKIYNLVEYFLDHAYTSITQEIKDQGQSKYSFKFFYLILTNKLGWNFFKRFIIISLAFIGESTAIEICRKQTEEKSEFKNDISIFEVPEKLTYICYLPLVAAVYLSLGFLISGNLLLIFFSFVLSFVFALEILAIAAYKRINFSKG